MHARMAAKNGDINDLPILITPHPLNDLTPEQLREMAIAAFPVVIEQLTGQGVLAQNAPINYVHPAVRDRQHCIDPNIGGGKP
jgi:hypothetical protein